MQIKISHFIGWSYSGWFEAIESWNKNLKWRHKINKKKYSNGLEKKII